MEEAEAVLAPPEPKRSRKAAEATGKTFAFAASCSTAVASEIMKALGAKVLFNQWCGHQKKDLLVLVAHSTRAAVVAFDRRALEDNLINDAAVDRGIGDLGPLMATGQAGTSGPSLRGLQQVLQQLKVQLGEGAVDGPQLGAASKTMMDLGTLIAGRDHWDKDKMVMLQKDGTLALSDAAEEMEGEGGQLGELAEKEHAMHFVFHCPNGDPNGNTGAAFKKVLQTVTTTTPWNSKKKLSKVVLTKEQTISSLSNSDMEVFKFGACVTTGFSDIPGYAEVMSNHAYATSVSKIFDKSKKSGEAAEGSNLQDDQVDGLLKAMKDKSDTQAALDLKKKLYHLFSRVAILQEELKAQQDVTKWSQTRLMTREQRKKTVEHAVSLPAVVELQENLVAAVAQATAEFQSANRHLVETTELPSSLQVLYLHAATLPTNETSPVDITSALTAIAVAEMVASRTIAHGFMGNIMNQVVFFEHLMAGETEADQREWSFTSAPKAIKLYASIMEELPQHELIAAQSTHLFVTPAAFVSACKGFSVHDHAKHVLIVVDMSTSGVGFSCCSSTPPRAKHFETFPRESNLAFSMGADALGAAIMTALEGNKVERVHLMLLGCNTVRRSSPHLPPPNTHTTPHHTHHLTPPPPSQIIPSQIMTFLLHIHWLSL